MKPTPLPGPHRRRTAFTTAAAVCTAALIASLSSATALPGADGCPQSYPADELVKGMEAEGFTVEQGTEPEPFDATVVGVVDGGIAPGIDMILVETESPAIERAGGIWSGMSGSPVYADDGRLLGAVAYGLSQSPSNIAGLTPAADMLRLLDRPDASSAPSAAPEPPDASQPPDAAGTSEASTPRATKVPLPPAIQEALVERGSASLGQAQAGMRALPLPLAVSGLGTDRLSSFTERLNEELPGARAYAAGAADVDEQAPADDIVPGGNIAAALSYGDVTSAGVGTTTVVCGDAAVAFGHPFQFTGQASASVHPAEALLVQRDDALGSYKVANPLGVAGTLDQDRQAGIRGMLGVAPPTIPVTSTVTSTDDGATRDGTTHVVAPTLLPDLATSHLLANVDRAFDAIGPGTADLRWVIEGTRGSGEPFTLDVENSYASRVDIGYDAAFDAFDQLRAIQQNESEDVEITNVDYTATLSSAFEQYAISAVELRRPDGTFREPSSGDAPVRVVAGNELAVRVTLTPYKGRGDATTVQLTVDVPADAAGGYGWVDITGGSATGDGDGDGDGGNESGNSEEDGGDGEDDGTPDSPAPAKGFDGLLKELDGLVSNNSVTVALTVEQENETGFSSRSWSDREEVDQVVSGSRSFQVQVVE